MIPVPGERIGGVALPHVCLGCLGSQTNFHRGAVQEEHTEQAFWSKRTEDEEKAVSPLCPGAFLSTGKITQPKEKLSEEREHEKNTLKRLSWSKQKQGEGQGAGRREMCRKVCRSMHRAAGI